MTALQKLFSHINQFIPMSEDDLGNILPYFDELHLTKKEIIMEAGSPCNRTFFVTEGCMHMYFVTEKGTERTVQFALENWWLTDVLAFRNQAPTDFYIQAVEESHLLSITYEKLEQLLKDVPELERYFRSIYQIAYGSSLMKMKYLFDYSKEEIYFHFTEHFPQFAQRVPQYLIASFLGLTPEYVSEIRAKKRS